MKIIVLIHRGFEEVEALTPVDLLRRAGMDVTLCSMEDNVNICGARKINIVCDKIFDDIKNFGEYDGVVLPGGLPNAHLLRDDDRVISLIKEFYETGRLVAAICASPCVLEKAGILANIEATSYPGAIDTGKCIYKEIPTVCHNNVITSRGVGTAIDFALKIIDYFGIDSKKIADAIIYNLT